MKTRVIITFITILLLLIVPFITVAKASGGTEIKYDDGSSEDQWNIGPAYKVGVMFTKNDLPYSQNLLTTVRIYIVYADAGQQLTMFFLDSHFNEIRPSVFTPALQVGWNDINVSSYGLVMTNDFLIAFQWLRPDGGRTNVWMGYDLNLSSNYVHTYEYNPYKWPYPYWHTPCDPTGGSEEYGNWMIRAVVEKVQKSTVFFPATSLWTDTGLTVTIGEKVKISASGSWSWETDTGIWFGPDGQPGTAGANNPAGNWDYFLYQANHGELIAFVGSDPYQGHWGESSFFPQHTGYWIIGSSGQFISNKTGDLWLGFNDDAVTRFTSDNGGSVTASIIMQYYLTVATNPPSVDSPTGEGWYDAGTIASISTAQYADIVPGSSRYRFNGWTTTDMSEITDPSSPSTTVLMDKAKTLTANYVTQYNVTFHQTGVGNDFIGTMITVDRTNYTRSGASFWYDNSSTHNFAFQSPLIVPPGAKQYDWTSTNGLSTLQSGSITVNASGSVTGNYVTKVHDVAVTSVVADRTWVYQGHSAKINVTVLDKGDFSETVTVTLYYNITDNKIVDTQSITLLVGESKTISFVWNTLGVAYCHNYTLTAVATIPADITPADNTMTNGKIKVRILGDINGNGLVDIKDIALAALAFGSYGPNYAYPGSPPHPRYDPNCDINSDGKVDIRDMVLIAKNFGKTYS